MTYNTIASMDKLTCTYYVVFGQRPDRLGQFLGSKNYTNFMHLKLRVLEKYDNKDI